MSSKLTISSILCTEMILLTLDPSSVQDVCHTELHNRPPSLWSLWLNDRALEQGI